MSERGVSADVMAWRAAQAIPPESVVNLGIGLPTRVAEHVIAERSLCHSENGILGVGPVLYDDEANADGDLINASKEPVGLRHGGSFFDHAISFAMVRGGHIDVAVMGAFEVSATGDLANWITDDPDAIPAVGGAMDLAVGAKSVYVIMRHVTREGEPKIRTRCSYPLTAPGVVDWVFTDLAVMSTGADGLVLHELAEGVSVEELRDCTEAEFAVSDSLAPYARPTRGAVRR
jgi:3-oxoadipate CoA-transferase beta subunit